MLFQFVAKGERGHPTWIYTWVYRVLNMHSDCHTNEPGSIVWQSEHTLICSDGTSSHCPPLRFMHIGIPRASTNRTSPIQSAPLSRVLEPTHCTSPLQCARVCRGPPPTHTHTSASPIYGAPHTGVNLPRGPSYSVTATPPMTPREAIPPLTSFVASREHSQLTWPGYRVPNIHSRLFGMAVRVHVWHPLEPG